MDFAAEPKTSDDVLAIILAGGRGSRLHDLTHKHAKPALPIGQGGRLIDYTLTNVVRSGIARTLVLTQYEPETLRAHLIRKWRTLGASRGFSVQLADGGDFGAFTGTADAIAKVSASIDADNPRHVVVLAGDHLYQMDYRPFVERHRKTGARVTVGGVHVPLHMAHELGVMSHDGDGRILAFSEKPRHPEEAPDRPGFALASMGIYVFDWPVLRDLLATLASQQDGLDFGKHVVPCLVESGEAGVYALPARGDAPPLWRDLGTLDAYHDVHADLAMGRLSLDPGWFNLAAPEEAQWPRRIPQPRTAQSSSRWQGCSVGEGALIGADCHLRNVVVLPGARVGDEVVLHDAIVTSDAIIPDGFDLDYALSVATDWCTMSENGIHILSARAVQALDQRAGGSFETAFMHSEEQAWPARRAASQCAGQHP